MTRSNADREKKFFDRLTAKFTIDDDHWFWTTPLLKGYGQFQMGGKPKKAHRVVYELLMGPIPEGMALDHMCPFKHCVRPGCMEVKSRSENSRRYWREERTQCKRGHPWPESRVEWQGVGYCIQCKRDREREAWRHKQGWYG